MAIQPKAISFTPAYSSLRLRRKSGTRPATWASRAGDASFDARWRANWRSLACCLRRLRFSRSAAASRALRAARWSALPPSLPPLTIVKAQSTAAAARQRLRARSGSLARTWPPMARIAARPHLFHGPDPGARCRSSVVEHSLGKGEVVSSILTGSTILRKLSTPFRHGRTGSGHLRLRSALRRRRGRA